ncbi:MAG: hypothetical protein K2M17_02950 [Bacilli bacterium]|nr:hypothetical protein [Bacilli bacterium]
MILNEINSDNYLYLRLLAESKHYPFGFMLQEENRENEAKKVLVRRLTCTIKHHIDTIK